VSSLGEKLDRLHERNIRQADATSIRGGTERQLVKAVKARFRTLPEPQRQQVPALLNAIGKLELAAGNYEEAHQDFRQVASLVGDRAARAAAHNNAFLAALEKKDWAMALRELLEASRLDPDQLSLFPPDRYEPERILGAGGFGIVFLCRNGLSKARVVVKALRTDELDRELGAVLEEAGALEQLHHEAIIRLRDCGYAGTNQTRPYLVMDYCDGLTLEDYVKQHGTLPAPEARVLARQMAEGLSAAHAKRILHRDVKPGNVLVERTASGLRSKLIDFGLALRQEAVHNTISNATALSNTIRGRSIAGTLDFASPEQMGKLPGESAGPTSDVYGYGRTLCFALFGTPKPGPRHWKELKDEPLVELIGDCIEESPKNRPAGFADVLARLAPGKAAEDPTRVARVVGPEETEPVVGPKRPGSSKPTAPAARAEPRVEVIGDCQLRTNLGASVALRLLADVFRDYGVTEVSADTSSVSGKTGFSMRSAGQVVSGRAERVPDGTLLTVSSKPNKQLFDWGRGKKEAREIVDLLAKRIRSL
jgi:serine/threonine protein kinase